MLSKTVTNTTALTLFHTEIKYGKSFSFEHWFFSREANIGECYLVTCYYCVAGLQLAGKCESNIECLQSPNNHRRAHGIIKKSRSFHLPSKGGWLFFILGKCLGIKLFFFNFFF